MLHFIICILAHGRNAMNDNASTTHIVVEVHHQVSASMLQVTQFLVILILFQLPSHDNTDIPIGLNKALGYLSVTYYT
jgi:hypothetical protein